MEKNELQIRIIDIGSANQRFSTGLVEIKNPYVIQFEPDKRSNCDGISDENGQLFPFALAGENGIRRLNLTRKPECSSFYFPNRKYLDLFPDSQRWDIIEQQEIECRSLDSLHKIIGNNDFLKIDTQGSELEILYGGKEIILDQLLGIESEVEFIPVYEEQPLFGDISTFLYSQGFEFYDFITEYRYNREKLDRTGQLAFADALFLRTPEYIYENYHQGKFTIEKVKKYKIIVEAYKKYDLSNVIDNLFRGLI